MTSKRSNLIISPARPLCCRPEVCGEAEELAEGGKALHKLEPRVAEDVFNFPAARAEQADGGAEVGFPARRFPQT